MRDRDEECCLPLGMGGQLNSAMYLLLAGPSRQTLYARLLSFKSAVSKFMDMLGLL